jgi:hypothetical protein
MLFLHNIIPAAGISYTMHNYHQQYQFNTSVNTSDTAHYPPSLTFRRRYLVLHFTTRGQNIPPQTTAHTSIRINVRQITRSYIARDTHLHCHHRPHLKSYYLPIQLHVSINSNTLCCRETIRHSKFY